MTRSCYGSKHAVPGAAQVQQVCVLVRERSARLIAATLAGILRHLHRDRCALRSGLLFGKQAALASTVMSVLMSRSGLGNHTLKMAAAAADVGLCGIRK